MKVSISWLKELVEINQSVDEVVKLINLKTIGTKEVTESFIELDMKGHHRADLLSMRGVALEIAAITDSKVKFTEDEPDLGDILGQKKDLDVEIRDSKLCPFYSLVKIENLKVGPSPKEWIKKLEECGMRSINNVADITNLVMLEYGQPMHAFDSSKVSQEKIIVRSAKEGEKIETLDGKNRQLETLDLLIADQTKPLGIAGVMGGKDSEISDSTTTVLLEAAIFDPRNIRQTASRLGLISEAGKRFYHGLTKKRLYQALSAAIKMYESLGGEATALSIQDSFEEEIPEITLRKEKVDSLIGVKISKEEIENYLVRLNFQSKETEEGWVLRPPYWRMDIKIEEDLIEEVARMYGYEKIPAEELGVEKNQRIDQKLFETIYQLKKTLVSLGLSEVQTYSFYSNDILNNVGWAPDRLDPLVKIANPISSETEYMRMAIWQNLLEVVAKNFKQGYEDMAVFELGKIYKIAKDERSSSSKKEITEDYSLAIALMNGSDNPTEELFAIVKKATEALGESLELSNKERGPIDEMLFHPTRFQHLLINGRAGGGIAEVHPRIVNKFGLDKRVAILEMPVSVFIKG